MIILEFIGYVFESAGTAIWQSSPVRFLRSIARRIGYWFCDEYDSADTFELRVFGVLAAICLVLWLFRII